MTTLLIVTATEEVRSLVPWARAIASAAKSELSTVLAQRGKGPTRVVAIDDSAAENPSELVSACLQFCADNDRDTEQQLYQLVGDDWMADAGTAVTELKPSRIIVPAPVLSKDQTETRHWQLSLLTTVDCEVILIQDDARAWEETLRLAVVLRDGFDNDVVLQHASRLIPDTNSDNAPSHATAVYVEPNVGDFAVSVGMQRLGSLLRNSLNRYEREQFEHRVIVSGTFHEAVGQLNPADYDLVLTGSSDTRTLRHFFTARVTSGTPDIIPARAAVRPAQSFSTQLFSRADRWLRSIVPQLDREERVDLVSRVQQSSQWDFDFILLVSLATLIACLGLAENSVAVIVGAMLVAPLMTPIAGVGLGVAHGNSFLTTIALRTALRGFATAMMIGFLFGLIVQVVAAVGWLEPLALALNDDKPGFPSEIENRTHPQFYDLLIALASGVAAAYAMGRPNLFSALPGVAIAAALVPPIATSGIAFAHLQMLRGGGALLLFVTNIVTIILGAAIAFRAVGIRSQKEGQSAAAWPRYTLLLLVGLSVLAVLLM